MSYIHAKHVLSVSHERPMDDIVRYNNYIEYDCTSTLQVAIVDFFILRFEQENGISASVVLLGNVCSAYYI